LVTSHCSGILLNVDQLKKILALEQSRDYTDSAVTSGLDRFLERFSEIHPNHIHLPYPNYRSLDPKERKDWIGATLKSISPAVKSVKARSDTKPAISLDSPITTIKGISLKSAPKFERMGVRSVSDLLYFFPRRHIDYTSPTAIADLQMGIEQTIMVNVWQATAKRTRRGIQNTEVIVGDSSGTMRVTFFNQPFLAKKFSANTRLLLSGKAGIWKGTRVFQPSSFEVFDSDEPCTARQLVPVYSLTEGLYPRQVRKFVRQALDSCLPLLKDFLPEKVKKSAKLIGLAEAIEQAHYPTDQPAKYTARRRLAFDELFLIQIGVVSKKRERQGGMRGLKLGANKEYVRSFLTSLPFELTSAQKRVLKETLSDINKKTPMSRLLHGDVGSGKTVVATGAMIQAVASSCQAALMVPTEILAEQHFQSICRTLGDRDNDSTVRTFNSVLDRPITVGLLTASISQKGKKDLYQRIAAGEIDILIGTQALIQKKVEFKQLALVVVDEQHRFGVMQRLALIQKGISPHMLAMSATPIPRTLALTVYGDLDISLIDELPPGRKEIKTKWLEPKKRQSGYNFVRKQVSEGRQAYVVCPLVEDSDVIDARAATVEYERLSQEIFPDLRLGLLHGRMSSTEKDEIMQQFRDGKIDVLVSTSVIEVGVDVPNATVMLVEGADRFGLSQLHQFRGRVWRSSYQGYCILLSDNPTEDGRERLIAMESTHNGFILAEKDLEMRGPGEFFGTRQSGLPDLKMARLTDVQLLELARREALRLVELDPNLQQPEHRALAAKVEQFWKSKGE